MSEMGQKFKAEHNRSARHPGTDIGVDIVDGSEVPSTALSKR